MVNKSSYIPLSRQVFDIIYTRIMDGTYKAGELLPSQGSFAKEFDVSMITVRQSFRELNNEKIIESRRGKGSIVKKRPKIYRGKHTAQGFTVDSKIQDYLLKTKNIKISSSYKQVEASYNLGIGKNYPIFINRLRIVNNKKVSFEFSYLNSLLLKNINWNTEFLDNMSLYSFIFEKFNYKITKAEEDILPVLPSQNVIDVLGLKNNNPILFIKRHTYIKGEKMPIEYCEFYIIPEFYGKIVYSVEN